MNLSYNFGKSLLLIHWESEILVFSNVLFIYWKTLLSLIKPEMLCILISWKQNGTLKSKIGNICNSQMEEKKTLPVVSNTNIFNKHPTKCLTGAFQHNTLTLGIPQSKWKGHHFIALHVSFQRTDHNKKLTLSLKNQPQSSIFPIIQDYPRFVFNNLCF